MTGSARPRRRRSRRVLIATGVLVATLGSVKFLDLNAKTEEAQSEPSLTAALSSPLALPDSPAALSEPIRKPSQVPNPPSTMSAALPPVLDLAAKIDTPTTVEKSETAVLSLTPQPTTPVALQASIEPPTAVDNEPSLFDIPPVPTAIVEQLDGSDEPETLDDRAAADDPPLTQPRWVEHQVVKGDSLAKIFTAQGLQPGLLHRIVNSGPAAKSLSRIRPGQTLRFRFDELGELTELEHHRSRVEHLAVAVTDEAVIAEVVSKAVDTRTTSAAGVIEASLFTDGQRAGMSDAKIMELAEIFGWDIDFALELRAGDTFRVIYEEHLLDGEKLRDGPILAAEFSNRGETYRAVRYETADGEVGYYDETGHSKRRAFLRTPIKFARISSRFNPKRWHPVLKRWRSHKGVDYAAPTGTPIKASGDGKVVHRGTKGGYGRTVILQHAGKYTTLYAHMSKYSKRARIGNRVKQGQVIGYVGRSGLASGPHLHYEFRVNGRHKDPLRVKLPKSLALPKQEIATFKRATEPLLAQLEAVERGTLVASADTEPAN